MMIIRWESGGEVTVGGRTPGAPAVKSSVRTLAVLEVLGRAREPISVAELHRLTGYPRSSLHQLLHTMIKMGWLEQTSDSMIGIGSRALLVGTAYLDRDAALALALRHLEDIRAETGYTTHYARRNHDQVIYLASREAHDEHRAVSRIGRQLPAHATALGKVLLAELSRDEVLEVLGEQPLTSLTDKTITDLGALHTELDHTRALGHSREFEENLPGIACVGVAVHYRIPATDAISCSIPLDQANDHELDAVAAIITRHAADLAAQLRTRGIR